jgi:hypothetical protein
MVQVPVDCFQLGLFCGMMIFVVCIIFLCGSLRRWVNMCYMLVDASSDSVCMSLADTSSGDELMRVPVIDVAAGCAFFNLACTMSSSAHLVSDDELVVDTASPVAFVLAWKCLLKSLGLDVFLDYDKVGALEISTQPEVEQSRRRAGNYDFLRHGIPVGAKLSMSGHPEITVRVIDGRRVSSDEVGDGYLTGVNRALCLRHGLDVTRRSVFTKWEWQGVPLSRIPIEDSDANETFVKDAGASVTGVSDTFDALRNISDVEQESVTESNVDVVDGDGSSADVDDSLPPAVDPFSW